MGKRVVTRPDWLSRTLRQRFDEKWVPEPYSGCWLWTGALSKHGYPRLSFRSKPMFAHRLSYLLAHGEMPDERMLVCHKCDTKSCVNPDHLFIGTWSDNLVDAIRKGIHTYKRGTGMNWFTVRQPRNPLNREKCKHGHLFSPENTYITRDGEVMCKECRRLSGVRQRILRGKPCVISHLS